VVDRPADVAPQPLLGTALNDESRDDDQAPVAQAEAIVGPRSAGGVDRLLGESLAVALHEGGENVLAEDAELARVGVEPALVAGGGAGWLVALHGG
jgi:hypothetical protein